jgi:hypothetical protein
MVLAATALLTWHAAFAADTPGATPDATVPQISCPQPKLPERVSVAQEDLQHLMEQVNAYARCVKAYVDARQAAANHYNTLLKQEVDAGNAAVKEINEFQARLNDFRERHDPKKQ